MTLTGTETHRPDQPIKLELAQKEKGAAVKTRQKQTSWQDANGSLKDLQPNSSLPVLKIHPEAEKLWEWFGVLPAKEAAELKANIQAIGVQVPILVTKDQSTIIDGRNRYIIAQELELKVKDVPIEVYQGKDEDVPKVILSLNLFRRHLQLTDDQRVALTARALGPQLRKEAAERKAAAQFGAEPTREDAVISKSKSPGPIHQEIAKQAKVSEYKGLQAAQLEERKPKALEAVISGKRKLRDVAGKAPKKPRAKKEKTLEQRVWHDYRLLLGHYHIHEQREVKQHLRNFLGGKEPTSADEPVSAFQKEVRDAKGKKKGGQQ
jgi:ParB/Sulfiredoxin domain